MLRGYQWIWRGINSGWHPAHPGPNPTRVLSSASLRARNEHWGGNQTDLGYRIDDGDDDDDDDRQ